MKCHQLSPGFGSESMAPVGTDVPDESSARKQNVTREEKEEDHTDAYWK